MLERHHGLAEPGCWRARPSRPLRPICWNGRAMRFAPFGSSRTCSITFWSWRAAPASGRRCSWGKPARGDQHLRVAQALAALRPRLPGPDDVKRAVLRCFAIASW